MGKNVEAEARELIRAVPDYPKKGVVFRDITPLLKDKRVFRACIDELAKRVPKADYVVGIESRGFVVGSALAYALGIGFVPARKEGKLPHKRIGKSYELEYGRATLEMHIDAIEKGSKVVIADDLIATGGTARATKELVEELGGEVVEFVFLVELKDMNGRSRVGSDKIISLISY